jgi:hypothetical protein
VRDARAHVGDAVQRQPKGRLVGDRRVDRAIVCGDSCWDTGSNDEGSKITSCVTGSRMMPMITGRRIERIACGETRRSGARRAEHLADLERVVAVAAVERGDRTVVVDDERSLPPRPFTIRRALMFSS